MCVPGCDAIRGINEPCFELTASCMSMYDDCCIEPQRDGQGKKMKARPSQAKGQQGDSKRSRPNRRGYRTERIREHDIIALQRSIGNKAVVKHITSPPDIQREDEMAGASMTNLEEAIKKTLGNIGEKKPSKRMEIMRLDLLAYEKTGMLKVHTFSAAVMSIPRFFTPSKKLSMLKRGDRTPVLGMKGAWCRVKTVDGVLGWIHRNHLIPIITPRWSSSDKMKNAGSSRDEVEIAGRA